MENKNINIKNSRFLEVSKKTINQYVSQSKIFWKEVIINYKKINNALL